MKIMLEHGGQFYSENKEELPPDVENVFLNHVVEFEKQLASSKMVSIFEKIGKPTHFKPEKEISDSEIDEAWKNLSEYMIERGVELSVCSPRVTARNLYRFSIGELFELETDDIKIPGMVCGYIYDEFYPDHEYDNTRSAKDCLRMVFSKNSCEWLHSFSDSIDFNDHISLTKDNFKMIVGRFKEAYDKIDLEDIEIESCKMNDKACIVKGKYKSVAKFGNETAIWSGSWLVESELAEFGYWYINNLQITGIVF
jgi:hypothetical protein